MIQNCCQGYGTEQGPTEEERNKNKKHVTLIFKRSELLYDIGNYGFVVSDIMPEETEHARHQIADITQDGNIDRVTRVLNLAFSECVEALYPFSKSDVVCGTQLDDVLTEPNEYVMELSVPSDFSETTLKLLENYIHEYLVCRVLSDWLGITYPQSAAVWEAKAQLLKGKMRSSLTSRAGRLRRRLKPW